MNHVVELHDVLLPLEPSQITERMRRQHESFYFTEENLRDHLGQDIYDSLDIDQRALLAEFGMGELIDRARMNRGLFRDLIRTAGIGDQGERYLAYLEAEKRGDSPSDDIPFALTAMQILRWPMDYRDREATCRRVLEELSLHPLDDTSRTIRRGIQMRALSIIDQIGQANTPEQLARLGELGVNYTRGNLFMELKYREIKAGLLKHFGLETDVHTFSYLTNKGFTSNEIAWEHFLSGSGGDVDLAVIGHPYRESMGIVHKYYQSHPREPKQKILRVYNSNDEIAKFIEYQIKENEKPLVLFFEPISSFKDMQLTDSRFILEKVAREYKDSPITCTLVVDITTLGGSQDFVINAKKILGDSNVRLIVVSSLLKYFEWGSDIVQGGVLLATGSGCEENGTFDKAIRARWHLHSNEPDITQIAYLPPVTTEYINFRKDRIMRNARFMAQVLQKCVKESGANMGEVVYPSLRADDKELLQFIGFDGSYLYINFGDKKVAREFIDKVVAKERNTLGLIEERVSFGHDFTSISQDGGSVRIVPGTEDICSFYFAAARAALILHSIKPN